MPKKFVRCVKSGGRVRTVTVSGQKYVYVCFPRGGGKSVAGEVHSKAKKPKTKK